jgi:hypothetical protein
MHFLKIKECNVFSHLTFNFGDLKSILQISNFLPFKIFLTLVFKFSVHKEILKGSFNAT